MNENLNAVYGTAPNDVWASGANGTILHFDGATWSKATSGAGATQLRGVSAVDAANAWAVGSNGVIRRWNLGAWGNSNSTTGETLYAVISPSLTNAYAAGSAGTLLQWNGTAWQGLTTGVTRDLRGVWFDGAGAAWSVGQDGVIVRAATTVTVMSRGQGIDLRSVWGNIDGTGWAVGDNGVILQRQANGWVPVTSNTTAQLNKVFGLADGQIFAVGNYRAGQNHFIRRSGGTWSAVALSTTPSAMDDLDDLWGTDDSNLWVVGGGGVIMKYVAGTLTVQASPPPAMHLRGISGVSPSYIWAVGDGGVALRYDGTTWVAVPTGTTRDLRSVWARSPTEAWAVGSNATALHYDGTAWKVVGTPLMNGENLDEVHGLAETGQVIAVGDAGTVLTWRQGTWERLNTSTNRPLQSAFVLDENNCWVAGGVGSILNISP